MGNYYCGTKGKGYTLDDDYLAKGGEGFIFAIRNHDEWVAKIYKQEKRTESLHRKLLAMLQTPLTDKALEQITWPRDVLYDSNNKFVGYVMTRLQESKDLNVLYSDQYKHITLAQKVIIAQNLCIAIDAVHKANQVCGDLNPKNIEVNPNTARITLVDTDSYHIEDQYSGRIYRCEVGLPEYIAPEVQMKMRNGRTLRTAALPTYTEDTDNFALAIHIFALIMNGCHPYACAVSNNRKQLMQNSLIQSQVSIVAPQPDENICNGRSIFFRQETNYKIPIYAPDINVLSPKLQELFRRTFVEGHFNPGERPKPEEWFYALEEYRSHLKQCKNNDKHVYYDDLSDCPWCKLEHAISQFSIPAPQKAVKKQPAPIVTPAQPKVGQPASKTNYTNISHAVFPVKSLIVFAFFLYMIVTTAQRQMESIGYWVSPMSDLLILAISGGVFLFNLLKYISYKNPSFKLGSTFYLSFAIPCAVLACMCSFETIGYIMNLSGSGYSFIETFFDSFFLIIFSAIFIYIAYKLIRQYWDLKK